MCPAKQRRRAYKIKGFLFRSIELLLQRIISYVPLPLIGEFAFDFFDDERDEPHDVQVSEDASDHVGSLHFYSHHVA